MLTFSLFPAIPLYVSYFLSWNVQLFINIHFIARLQHYKKLTKDQSFYIFKQLPQLTLKVKITLELQQTLFFFYISGQSKNVPFIQVSLARHSL